MIKCGATEDLSAPAAAGGGGEAAPTDIYGFTALESNLDEYMLSQSRGRAVLVVNVASF